MFLTYRISVPILAQQEAQTAVDGIDGVAAIATVALSHVTLLLWIGTMK